MKGFRSVALRTARGRAHGSRGDCGDPLRIRRAPKEKKLMAAEVAEISSSCFSASWPWEIIQNRSSNVYHVLPSIPQGCPGKNDFPWMVDLTPVPSQNLWMPNHLLKMAAKLEPNPPVAQPPSCHSLLCQPPQRVVLQITNALLRPCEVMVSYSSQSQRLQTG